jgi:hypothetical protein
MNKFNLEAVIVNGGVVIVALTIFWGGFVYLFKKWMSDREASEDLIRKELADTTAKTSAEIKERIDDLKERIVKVSEKQESLTEYQRVANGKVAQISLELGLFQQKCKDRISMHQRTTDHVASGGD